METRLVTFDIGGTNGRALEFRGTRKQLVPDDAVTKFKTGDFLALEDALWAYFNNQATDAAMCLALPGPVEAGICNTTNLPWVVSKRKLTARLNVQDRQIFMLNDFLAAAHGVNEMTPVDFVTLNQGRSGWRGNLALMGPGSGLGEAGLSAIDRRPFPTEGGHVNFAPFDDTSLDLCRHMMNLVRGPVSVEMLASGPGLVSIFWYVCERARTAVNCMPEWFTSVADADKPAAISRCAIDGTDDRAISALKIFLDIVASEAGNIALKLGAWDGVFIWGGIIPQIASLIDTDRFVHIFSCKGKGKVQEKLLQTVPLHIIVNERLALVGARRFVESEWLQELD